MKAIVQDTIIALSTPAGSGAIGVIRLSGPSAIVSVDNWFYGANLQKVEGNSVHYGKLKDSDDVILDECVAIVFRAPRSYTKEDVVELSCHGSPYILSEVIKLLLREDNVRLAEKGEFTLRAYLNGQLDLSQAEAVADLIASKHKSAHTLAMSQLRGGFSKKIKALRGQMIEFASLLELENDFGEEDVEFANREQLGKLITQILEEVRMLIDSYNQGNVMKEGILIALVGAPNVGKSTLLNALLEEDKAIVSDIPGTTRDAIEDTMTINGYHFRFVDTAGMRQTEDTIENLGIEKTRSFIKRAQVVCYLDDINKDYMAIVEDYRAHGFDDSKEMVIVLNKIDQAPSTCNAYDVEESVSTLLGRKPTLSISAEKGSGLDMLKQHLVVIAKTKEEEYGNILVTNIRHLDCLKQAFDSLTQCQQGLHSGVTSDFLAMDIRHANHSLAEIVGEISTDDLLDSIFSNFCIGK